MVIMPGRLNPPNTDRVDRINTSCTAYTLVAYCHNRIHQLTPGAFYDHLQHLSDPEREILREQIQSTPEQNWPELVEKLEAERRERQGLP